MIESNYAPEMVGKNSFKIMRLIEKGGTIE
jgi:hypothetical protein